MSITIKQVGENWRIALDEEWEVKDFADFKTLLDDLLAKKQQFGQVFKKPVQTVTTGGSTITAQWPPKPVTHNT